MTLNNDDNNNLCDQITLEEVKNAVNSMQNGKALAIDEIPMKCTESVVKRNNKVLSQKTNRKI